MTRAIASIPAVFSAAFPAALLTLPGATALAQHADPLEPGSPAIARELVLDEPPELDIDTSWRFTGVHVTWENDGTYADPFDETDRHYTNGTKLELTWDPRFDDDTREFLAPAGKWPDAKLAVGFVLAQHIYVGSDIEDRTPAPDDRPYAGYLYGGLFFQRATDTVHDHFELDVGVVGSWSLAEDTQRFVHGLPGQVEPQGWSNQLANELAVNFRYQRSWRTERAALPGALELDAIPRLGFDLGNVFVRGNADVTLRLGRHLPDDFGPGRLLDYRDATGSWVRPDQLESGEAPGWGAYAYVRLGARAVGRNMFLDGNTFADSRSTDPERFVGELELGLRARFDLWGGDLLVGYGWTVSTREYRAQNSSDTYGAWSVGWQKRF